MSYRDPRTTRSADDDVVEVHRTDPVQTEPRTVAGHAVTAPLDDRRTLTDDERRHVHTSGRAAARERFGGMHVGAQLVGMLTALATTVLLAGILGAAIGGIAYETGIDERLNATPEEISIGSVIAGIVVLAIAFLVGGWAAGRMSRYDGGRNGLMTAVWFLVLGVVLAALGLWAGTEYNVAAQVDLLPDWFGTWFEGRDVAIGAVVSGVAAIVVMFVAGFAGGKLGERFHRRADEVVALHGVGDLFDERTHDERTHDERTHDERTVTHPETRTEHGASHRH